MPISGEPELGYPGYADKSTLVEQEQTETSIYMLQRIRVSVGQYNNFFSTVDVEI